MKDPFGRDLNYVRISVTDRCNYRCLYCMPQEGVNWIPHGQIMTYEDIFFLVETLQGLGTQKIRFTGGEPLVRRGMLPFLGKLRTTFPNLQVALTTNGSSLLRDAEALAALKLHSINVSLDTLDPDRFDQITRGASLKTVLSGIDALMSAHPPNIKMNVVLIRGFNDGEAGALIDFARTRGMTLRFIEFMPLDRGVWSEESFIAFEEALSSLKDAEQWREEPERPDETAGPARYYVNTKTGQKLGVISAVSRHFCASCNRLRVTSVGDVRSCLFSNRQISISDALKSADADLLRERLYEAASQKPETGTIALRTEQRQMFKIGG